jgi:deoxycytidylate deaminase
VFLGRSSKVKTIFCNRGVALVNRTGKDDYYLNIALEVSKRGTCLRRNYGAVIVNYDEIISTGYTGAPRGTRNCVDIGYCVRSDMGVPSGERYELCRSVHAEMNAVIHASRRAAMGGTMYLMGMDIVVYLVKDWITHEDLDYGLEPPIAATINNKGDA